jgi:heat shock protein HslJ
MKNSILTSLLISLFLFSACCSTKTDNAKEAKTSIYNTTWELEYISGARIAFEGLYPETKPIVFFDDQKSSYSGNTSCNGYTGSFKLENNVIIYGETTRTMRYCEGSGEETFLGMLKRANKPVIDSEGKLLMMMDDIPMMRFKKVTTENKTVQD